MRPAITIKFLRLLLGSISLLAAACSEPPSSAATNSAKTARSVMSESGPEKSSGRSHPELPMPDSVPTPFAAYWTPSEGPVILQAPLPDSEKIEAASSVSGSVALQVSIAPDGLVRSTTITRSVPNGTFDALSAVTLSAWRFAPADGMANRTARVHLCFYRDGRPGDIALDTGKLFSLAPESAMPRVPHAQPALRQDATVVVRLRVDPDGNVSSPEIEVSDLPDAYQRSVLRAVQAWHFMTAMPVCASHWVLVPVNFSTDEQ